MGSGIESEPLPLKRRAVASWFAMLLADEHLHPCFCEITSADEATYACAYDYRIVSLFNP
jgi:hypothetical protein